MSFKTGIMHPTEKDLEYYFQVQEIQAKDLLSEVLPIQKHIENCEECQIKIGQMKSFMQESPKTLINSSCPLKEDLEYFCQLKETVLPEIQAKIQKIREHVSRCNFCQEEVKKWEAAMQVNSNTLELQPIPCLSESDLDYYLQIRHVDSKDIQNDILGIRNHLIQCSHCQKRLAEKEKTSRSGGETIVEDFRQIVAGCQILQKIGGGAMGEVFKALKLSLNRLVAIKVLKAHTFHGAVIQPERFQREAMTLAKIDHPNVTRVYEYAVSPDHENYYLILQYVDGEDLEKRIRTQGPFPLNRAIPIFLQILEGLQILHDANVLHRDLKPSNILIDKKESIKITDFGLAKSQSLESMQLTQANMILGTPQYMSPEACRGENQTLQSDIYSLGCVFHYLLTGSPPFKGKTVAEFIYQHTSKEAPLLSTKLPSIPPKIDKIVDKMLKKSLSERYSRCEAIMKDLLDYLIQEGPSTQEQSKIFPFLNFLENRSSLVQQSSSSLDKTEAQRSSKFSSQTTKTVPLPPQESGNTTKRIASELEPPDNTKRITSETPTGLETTQNTPGTSRLAKNQVLPKPQTSRLSLSSSGAITLGPTTKRIHASILPNFFTGTELLKREPTTPLLPKTEKKLWDSDFHKLQTEMISLSQTFSFEKPSVVATPSHQIAPEIPFFQLIVSLENCIRCSRAKPSSHFFSCTHCQQKICIDHRAVFQMCEQCLERTYGKNQNFKQLFEKLVLNQKLVQSMARQEGEVNVNSLTNVFRLIFFETSEDSLLALGNTQRKRGLYFSDHNVSFLISEPPSFDAMGKLFQKRKLLTPEQWESLVKQQQSSKLPMQDILLKTSLFSENQANAVFMEQLLKEIFAITFLEKSLYKFKIGKAPQELFQNMQLGIKVTFPDIFLFKRYLLEVFRHLSFIMTPGTFDFTSTHGKLKLVVEALNISIIQFVPENPKTLAEQYIKAKKITMEQWMQAQNQAQETPEEYLLRNKIVSLTDVRDARKKAIVQFLNSSLQTTFHCHFSPQSIPFNSLASSEQENLTFILYEIFAQVQTIQPLLSAPEIFTLIYGQTVKSEIIKILRTNLQESLSLSVPPKILDDFEHHFLLLCLLKSNHLNYLKSLQQQATVYYEKNLIADSDLILECSVEIF